MSQHAHGASLDSGDGKGTLPLDISMPKTGTLPPQTLAAASVSPVTEATARVDSALGIGHLPSQVHILFPFHGTVN